MRDFHQSQRQAEEETPLSQAFALRAWAIENNGLISVERSTDGYIAQQWRKALAPCSPPPAV